MKLYNPTKNYISHYTSILKKKNISEPLNSIKFILLKTFGFNLRHYNYFFKTFVKSNKVNKIKWNKQLKEKFHFLVLKRIGCYPIQYILEEWFFRDFIVKVIPPVLIPRIETEKLVDITNSLFKDYKFQKKKEKEGYKFLEVGVGSGVIFISLLRENNNLKCVGLDIVNTCIELSQINAELLVESNRYTLLNENFETYLTTLDLPQFDFLVSNPPYIKTSAENVMKDVFLYESHNALFSGPEGLDLITKIIINSRKIVKKGGFVILEIDPMQRDNIFNILIKEKFNYFLFENDIFERCRFVIFYVN